MVNAYELWGDCRVERFKKETPSEKEINRRLYEIIEISEDAVIETDIDGKITYWNNGAQKIYGYTRNEVIGKDADLLFINGREELLQNSNRLKSERVIKDEVVKRIKKDGNEIFVNTTIFPINDDSQKLIGTLSIARDMEGELQKDKIIKEANNNFRTFVENLPGFAFVKDKDTRAQLLSKGFEKYFNLPVSSIIGRRNEEYWSSEEAERITKDDLATLKLEEGAIYTIEENLKIGDKDIVLQTCKFPIVQANGEKLVAGLSVDITDIRNMEKKVKHRAYHDELTNLPNRALFNLCLDDELQNATQTGKGGAVYFIDLDNFKYINDTYGHNFGDKVLCCIADKLREHAGENSLVSRFGGDEFLIIEKNIISRNEAEKSVKGILNIFNHQMKIDKNEIFLTASIGILMYPNDGHDCQEVLQNVDAAMYAAKENGKNNFYFFQKSLRESIIKKTKLEVALRQALENEEFYLNYQPLVDSKSKKIIGAEALIRWDSPVLGRVSPIEFIPFAEETGLIIPIGEWVLRESCRQNKLWHVNGYKDMIISVNISEVQLRQPGFTEIVKNILNETGLDPVFLEIEITESRLMESMDTNVRILDELKKLGIKISLDDFGTGYSSLNYLKALPIDTVKIDKSFIDNICTNSNENAITEGIIFLAHRIGLNVTAEGVELKEQYELLNDEECDKIQGYIFSRPVLAEKVEEMILKGKYDLE